MVWKPPEFANHPESFDAPTWRGFCHQVVDGDTYTVLIDQGFLTYTYQRIRLRGWNAPELVGADAALGQAAKRAAEELLFAKPVLLTAHRDERSFERWVADVLYYDGTLWLDVGTTLHAAGHVKAA